MQLFIGNSMSFILMLAGFCFGLLARKQNWFGDNTPQLVNKAIIHVALPAMILLKVPALQLDLIAVVPVAFAWLVILVSAITIMVLAKLLKWPNEITGAMMLIVPLSNSAYFGIPFINAISNDQSVRYAIMYDQFGSFFGVALYAPIVIAWLSHNEKFRPLSVLKSIVSFTPFPVALIAIFLLNEHSIPDLLQTPLAWIASAMGPAAAFVIGYALQLKLPKSLHQPLYFAVGLKLVVLPMMVFILATQLNVYEPARQASVLQSAMPSMITAGLVAISAGFSEKLVIAVTGVSTLLSIISVSCFLLILGLI